MASNCFIFCKDSFDFPSFFCSAFISASTAAILLSELADNILAIPPINCPAAAILSSNCPSVKVEKEAKAVAEKKRVGMGKRTSALRKRKKSTKKKRK